MKMSLYEITFVFNVHVKVRYIYSMMNQFINPGQVTIILALLSMFGCICPMVLFQYHLGNLQFCNYDCRIVTLLWKYYVMIFSKYIFFTVSYRLLYNRKFPIKNKCLLKLDSFVDYFCHTLKFMIYMIGACFVFIKFGYFYFRCIRFFKVNFEEK